MRSSIRLPLLGAACLALGAAPAIAHDSTPPDPAKRQLYFGEQHMQSIFVMRHPSNRSVLPPTQVPIRQPTSPTGKCHRPLGVPGCDAGGSQRLGKHRPGLGP